jgi:hypothetical protein
VWSHGSVLLVAGVLHTLAYWLFFIVMHLRSQGWASGQVLYPFKGYLRWFYRTILSEEQVQAVRRSPEAAWHPFLMLGSLVFISALYVWLVLRARNDSLHLRPMLGLALLASVPLLLLPNLLSSDIYSYIEYGRIAAIHGGNPFTQPPSFFSKVDPFYRFVNWKNVASVYGPTWIYVSMLVTLVVESIHSHVIAYVLAYKLLALGLHLTNGVLIWSILGRWRPQQQQWGTALYLLNPVTMIEFVGNGHNDVLMLTLILLAFWFHLRGRWPWAMVALTLAVLAKWIALLLLPLYGLALLWESRTWRERAWRTALSLTLFVGICAVLYRPYWEGPRTLKILVDAPPQKRLINSMADVLSTGIQRGMARAGAWPDPAIIDAMTIFKNPNASLLLANGATDGQDVWQQQAEQFARDRSSFNRQQGEAIANRDWLNKVIRNVALGVFALVCLVGAALTRSFERAVLVGAWLFWFYCAISSVWFWPWYLTWFLALAALLDWRVTARTAIIFSLLSPLTYIFFPATANPTWWQQYRALMVFLPPILFAAWHGWHLLRSTWHGRRTRGQTPMGELPPVVPEGQ